MSESHSRSDLPDGNFGFVLSLVENRSRVCSFRNDFLRIAQLEKLSQPETSQKHTVLKNEADIVYEWPRKRREIVEIPVPKRRPGRPPLASTPPIPVIQKVTPIPVFEAKPAPTPVTPKRQPQPATAAPTAAAPMIPAALVSALPQQLQQHLGVKPTAKTRTNFTQQQRQLLDKFFYDHIDHPYVEQKDLEKLERETNLTKRQIRVFMTNARMRKYPKYRGMTMRSRQMPNSVSPQIPQPPYTPPPPA